MAKKKRGKKMQQVQDMNIQIHTKPFENPDWRQDLDGVKGIPRFVATQFNMRESPIAWMLAHKQIDEAQAKAGGHFRMLYEAASGSNLVAMDTTREPVDGGAVFDGITDHRMDAAKELVEARKALGPVGYDIVASVCGDCRWVKDLGGTQWRRLRAADHLRECLTTLAVHWGYQSPRVRAWRAAV